MFIATVHKAERKTVVESAVVSSASGTQSEGFSSNFLPLPWGPGDRIPAPVWLWLELILSIFWCHNFIICAQWRKITLFIHKYPWTCMCSQCFKSGIMFPFDSPELQSVFHVLILMHAALFLLLKMMTWSFYLWVLVFWFNFYSFAVRRGKSKRKKTWCTFYLRNSTLQLPYLL